ncbi:Aspartyl-tRNA(Asn) amidotransferase subunit B @ Glutamyl-tRNA(Gln) amidotransferase subunit B [hydrothermal vent metagenome]|uniref:Aspartyl-tRNA(Asn) amidotransferase subunit B @ Glutamyl-tRNA(Gln) amidotransferase subunit B n=1 Tax=hydrothermal vent metagenome TaxID=652676 RepID=A0A3B0VQN5_9ZZZZ
MNNITQWETVIGLEIHTQLKTNSKLFAGTDTTYGASPNSQVSLLEAAVPGTLPVFNEKVLRYAIRFGLAVGAKVIAKESRFDRKNYFYPDSPKGYQITQLKHPIVEHGTLVIPADSGKDKVVRINRAHIEEDAGKSVHDKYTEFSGIDLNRCGTPLIEIVSEPDLSSAKEAVTYMKEIHTIVTHLGICDGNLQEGSFRCDANVSIRPKGQKKLGTRTELKNINSFRFVEKAINIEIKRQIKILESGNKVVQETRLYDSVKHETRSMRSKEEANDYRYFPDPDLLPVVINQAYIDNEKQYIPEFPASKIKRYTAKLGLKPEDARNIAYDQPLATLFDATVKLLKQADAKVAANIILGEFSALLNIHEAGVEQNKITPAQLAGLLEALATSTISYKIAKVVLEKMWSSEVANITAMQIISTQGLAQVSDSSELEKIITNITNNNPSQFSEYKQGNMKMFNFFVGQVMKQTKGRANPAQVKAILEKM